jgi:hypothetical protein
MPTLRGLPGTDGSERECDLVRTVTAAFRSLRRGRPAAFAADNGAINVWRDDAGTLRGERYFYTAVRESKKFSSLKKLAVWLKRAIRKTQ